MRTYAIGDIHGQLDKLKLAHRRIAEDKSAVNDPDATVVHLGDLPDRGPDTRGVIDYLLDCREAGAPHVILLGNHDRMMRRFLHPERLRDQLRDDLDWLAPPLGGRQTLASYGVDVSDKRPAEAIHEDAQRAVPARHLALLDSLETPYSEGACLFVHAGIRPGIPLDQQSRDDLVWIREPFLSDTRDHGPLIVHGHTPVEEVMHCGNRLNLDTGAGYGRPLSAVVIEGRDVWLLTETGREPVLPVKA
ncbi:metallophosphoesterase [Tropicimonas marinistellae]|uniref:metallophosphoesterase n=1 Tax=Tropicimonas marinistellae TaxID=1739787 RepID=UPI00082D758C|nr:metallophosphoesterase [Tropicimonas marinistellae]